MCQIGFQAPGTCDNEEEELSITSCACQWKSTCKRKQSTTKISETTFNKHRRRKKPSSNTDVGSNRQQTDVGSILQQTQMSEATLNKHMLEVTLNKHMSEATFNKHRYWR